MYKLISFLTFVLVYFASLAILVLPTNLYLSSYQIDIRDFWDFVFALRQIAEIGVFNVRVDVVCAIGWIFAAPFVSAAIALYFSKQQPGEKRARIHQRPGQYRLPPVPDEDLLDREMYEFRDLEHQKVLPIDLADLEGLDVAPKSDEVRNDPAPRKHEPKPSEVSGGLPSFMDMEPDDHDIDETKPQSIDDPVKEVVPLREETPDAAPHLEAWMIEEEPVSSEAVAGKIEEISVEAEDTAPVAGSVLDGDDTVIDQPGSEQKEVSKESAAGDHKPLSDEDFSKNHEDIGVAADVIEEEVENSLATGADQKRATGFFGSMPKWKMGFIPARGKKRTHVEIDEQDGQGSKDDSQSPNGEVDGGPRDNLNKAKKVYHSDLAIDAQLMRWHAVWVKTRSEERSDRMRQEAAALAGVLFGEKATGAEEALIIAQHGMAGINAIQSLKAACQPVNEDVEPTSNTESNEEASVNPVEDEGLFDEEGEQEQERETGGTSDEVKDTSDAGDQWDEVASMFAEPELDDEEEFEVVDKKTKSSGSELEELDSLFDAPKKKVVSERITGEDLPSYLSELSMIEAQLRVYTINEDNYALDDDEEKADLWKQMDSLARKIERFKEESGESEVRRIEFALKDKRQRWWFSEGVGKVRVAFPSNESRAAFEEDLVESVEEDNIF